MTGLEKSAKRDTVGMILTVLLYGAGAASIPYEWVAGLLGGSSEVVWICGFLLKTACAILPVYLIFQFGFERLFKMDGLNLRSSILILPALLVMVNNLPIIPLMSGDMSINATFTQFLLYALFCLSIGVIEETVFRGCVLPLVLFKCEKSKKGVFGSIIISSAIFGAMHLLNLLGGFNPYVFLQVGYSFLIGAVCGFALIVCGNIFVPILLHAIFDFGGFFLSEGIATGRLWTLPNIIWTAVFSIAMATAIIAIFFKNDFSGIYQRLNLDRLPEEEGEGRK